MISRLGEINKNNQGTPMKIVTYRNHDDIDIEFLDDFHYIKRHNTYSNFKTGQIKNPYDRALFGVGYIGDGKWKVKDENGKFSRVYLCWMHMIERCYYEKNKDLHPAYFGTATVCDEWHNFQTFADWYSEREYDCEGRLHIDKDIKCPGNMVYSPETCILVPQRINMLFMNKFNNRGLPNGIIEYKSGYLAKYGGKDIDIFPTVESAYKEYSLKKKEAINKITNEYKNILPKDVYQAIINFKFSINNDKNYVA